MMRDVRSGDIEDCAFHRFGLTGGFVTATLHCSRCGKTHQEVGLPMYSEDIAMAMLLQKVYHHGWRCDDNQVLCWVCSETPAQQLSA